MDFDDQLRRYFGTDDPATIAPGALEAGVEKMRVDFGMEKDKGRRFALWTLMHLFGAAPDLDVAFDNGNNDTDRIFFTDYVLYGFGGTDPNGEQLLTKEGAIDYLYDTLNGNIFLECYKSAYDRMTNQ